MSARRFEEIPAALRKGWERTSEAEAWVELLGPHVPEDVRRLPIPRDGGFLLASPGPLLAAENAFGEAVRLAAEGGVMEPVLQVLTNAYFLAHVPGEGDCLMFHAPLDSETSDVVAWSHETGALYGPLAFDLPTALRVLEVAEASDAKRATRLRPALGRYRGDEFPLSLLEDGLREDGVLAAAEPKRRRKFVPPKSRFELIASRAGWLAEALTGRTPAPDAFVAQLEWAPDAALANAAFSHYPPSVLYWMWRSYLLGHDETLAKVVAAAEQSSARLVRDAVRFLASAPEPIAAQRQAIGALVAHALDPFPPTVAAGPVTCTRDDALEVEVASAEVVAIPPCEGTQPMNATWATKRYDGSPAWALLHPDGDRVLVVGTHDHPRKGRHPSIPNHVSALLEVDRATGAATIFCTLGTDGSKIAFGRYWNADCVIVGGDAFVSRYERHAGRGVLVESLRTHQRKAVFLPECEAIVLFGGMQLWREGGWTTTPESVEVVALRDGRLVSLASAPVALAEMAWSDGALVGASADGKARYRVEVEWHAPRSEGLVFHPSGFVEQASEIRRGPGPVLDALSYTDYSYESPGGRCLVLKLVAGSSDYQVLVGGDDGLREAGPPLVGTIRQHEFMGAERSFLRTAEAVHAVDLRTGAVEKLFALASSAPLLEVLSAGFAAVDDGALSVMNLAGETIRRVALGPGAATINALHGGKALAFSTEASPLVVVAIAEDEVRLVGSVAPEDPLAAASFETMPRPEGYHRLFARLDGRLHEAHGLEAAIADRGFGRVLDERLPDAPWEDAPIRLAR